MRARPRPHMHAEADGATVASAPAVVCAAYTDEEYRRVRCAPGEFEARYASRGIDRLWRDDVLPCRAYLRHCVLAADKLGPEVRVCMCLCVGAGLGVGVVVDVGACVCVPMCACVCVRVCARAFVCLSLRTR